MQLRQNNLLNLLLTKRKKLVESARRTKLMNDLLTPLGNSQRGIMTDLLETVQTDRLTKSFNKYLPSVIDGNTLAKRKANLTESTGNGKAITGNRTKMTPHKADVDNNVIDIKRLAGLN